ncbi:thiamine diphosphokinase [Gudongella sp. DL1XJH-153]|uniref:thiamine diphosphokinase n=1 Tax=Gudongella sp. DL1XJH-153 TaxID=3409804 RepID=UPI003BB4E1D4
MKGLISAGGTGVRNGILIDLCKEADIIVAADSGFYNISEASCRIDYLIGDFDSIDDINLIEDLDSSTTICRYPIEKDKTDTELAIDLLVEKGCTEITIIGGTGSRIDHSLSNIFMIRSYHLDGISIKIINDNNEISYLPIEILLRKDPDYYYSILPVGPEGVTVTLEGFHYPLQETHIRYGSSLGISNYIDDELGKIIRHSGEGFLVKSRD